MLTNFDIFATAGGEYKGVAESFTATASSAGAVTIQFVTVKDNAQVNGIEISPVGGGTGPGDTVTVTNPGSQVGAVGTAASLQIAATDSASGQTLTYTATGLPAGLSINSATGLITGTPTTTVTANTTVTATTPPARPGRPPSPGRSVRPRPAASAGATSRTSGRTSTSSTRASPPPRSTTR